MKPKFDPDQSAAIRRLIGATFAQALDDVLDPRVTPASLDACTWLTTEAPVWLEAVDLGEVNIWQTLTRGNPETIRRMIRKFNSRH